MREPIFLDDPHRPAVRVVRQIDHPVDRVWAGVTTEDDLRRWFPGGAAIEPRTGGSVHFGENGESGTGEVLEWDPPHRLAFTWEDDRLSVELQPDAGGTLLTLTHDFDDRAGAASFACGWEHCLAALACDLAGKPSPAEEHHGAARHEQLVVAFGLDRPLVIENDAGWHMRFERQLTAPPEAAWEIFLGAGTSGRAPAVGDALRRPGVSGALGVRIGTVTAVDPPHLLSFVTVDGVPGDRVELRLVAGTGHGARLVFDVHGSDAAERERAIERWGGGTVAEIARDAVRWES